MTRRLARLRDEDGAVTVMIAMAMPVLLVVCVFAIDASNWWVHKRHLQNQADASALAAARSYRFPSCDDIEIRDMALRYSGKGDAVATYNPPGDVATPQSRLHAEINAADYHGQPGNPGDTDIGGSPCESKVVDVKMTETDLPFFWAGALVDNINAQARVALYEQTQADRLLPIGIQEAAPTSARAIVVDEANPTVPLGSVALTAKGSSDGLQIFNNDGAPLSISVAAGVSRIGVRIALSGTAAIACTEPLVTCYDTEGTNGLSFIRGWNDTTDPGSTDAPVARSVYLTGGTCPSASFVTADASCTINVNAKVKWQPSVTQGDIASGKAKVFASIAGGRYAMTYAPATQLWTVTGVPVAAGTIGPQEIDLDWEQSVGSYPSSAKKDDCDKKTCEGTISSVQRTFWNDPLVQDSRGGPIGKLEVLDASTTLPVSDLRQCSATNATCTYGLNVQVGIKGALALSESDDPPVALRVDGNQTQSLQCDPDEGGSSGLENMIATGCAPKYKVSTGQLCLAKNVVWAGAQPWPCVALRTGDPPNATTRGLNRRILCNPALGDAANCSSNGSATSCTQPNNWPDYPDNDPRIVDVFLTPFGTFTGTGLETVPVIGFASFYVTGYKGQGGGVNTPCESEGDAFSDSPVPAGNVSGHYIKRVTTNTGGASNDLCDFTSVSLCTAVLVK